MNHLRAGFGIVAISLSVGPSVRLSAQVKELTVPWIMKGPELVGRDLRE